MAMKLNVDVLGMNMNKLLKILVLVFLCGLFALNRSANAVPLCDFSRAYNLTELTKTFSLFKQLSAHVDSKIQYLPKLSMGRNKYGYPVPDPVKTAHGADVSDSQFMTHAQRAIAVSV
jgi:hypothetical protein